MKKIIITSLFAVVTAVSLSAQAAEKEGKGKRGKPPAEAFEICVGQSENNSCSFSSERGDVTGVCKAPPRGEGELACVPERGNGSGERPERGTSS